MDRKRFLRPLVATTVVALIFAVRSGSTSPGSERVIRLTAKKFEYSPSEITVRKGERVSIEIVSLDRKHGFTIPDLKVRADVKPGVANVVRFTADRTGTFNFHCDLFCGSGHEGMAGMLIVVE
ncbi:MAG TPA: cupredoxin domain-containing protein [Candidatus Binatia bacterium]|nr:cupredoxin domain-containing protein [Candidatus Binatia bacterium]